MSEKNYTGLVPANDEGSKITAETVREYNNESDAKTAYAMARQRLLDINHWQRLAGASMARFQLCDGQGREIAAYARRGLFVQIDIPGPGSVAGDGYDWVEIEEIKEVEIENGQSLAILVRPAGEPGSAETTTAHFYDSKSTSTFTLTREGKRVTAAVYDRNIVANTESEGLVDKVRNAITGLAGKAAFSKIQWEALTDGLFGSGKSAAD